MAIKLQSMFHIQELPTGCLEGLNLGCFISKGTQVCLQQTLGNLWIAVAGESEAFCGATSVGICRGTPEKGLSLLKGLLSSSFFLDIVATARVLFSFYKTWLMEGLVYLFRTS